MAILPIITLPDPILRKESAQIERVDEALRKLADDMLETMYDAPGVGLAAVQVGVPRRLIVLDTAKDEGPHRPLVLINPEIVSLGSEMRLHEEGCLSIPDVRIEIERPASLAVRFLDREGRPQELQRRGPAGHRHPARDRPPERQADHRLPFAPEARHHRAQVQEAGQGRGRAREKGAGARGVRPLASPANSKLGGEGPDPGSYGDECCASSSWERPISRCRRWRQFWPPVIRL